MSEYRLSARNQVRRKLRLLGYERIRYQVERWRMTHALARYCNDLEPMTHTGAQEYFGERTLVFCVTPGRTGTMFAASLLELAAGVVVRHEPHPCFTWTAREAVSDEGVASAFWLNLKLPAIKALETQYYVETSHMFAKGFAEPLIALGIRPKVLSVGRHPRDVALSFLEKYTIPRRSWLGMQWLLDPEDPTVVSLPRWRRFSDYQLCFWYALEMERRRCNYARDLPEVGVDVYELQMKELHQFDVYVDLLRFIGLRASDSDLSTLRAEHERVIGHRFNRTSRRRLEFFGDLDALDKEVWEPFDAACPELREWIDQRYIREA